MSEWWTYRLSDFLMFSPETYHRLFARYNADLWPAQLLTLAAGVAILLCCRRGDEKRSGIAAVVLAACWLLVAWQFHWVRFREIHLAAGWFAAAFAVEGLLLLSLLGSSARLPAGGADRVGSALVVFGLFLQPLIGPALGRPWQTVEVFGLAPDPTVTVGFGALLAVRARWFLWPVPVLYSLVTGATLWTMESADAFVPLAVAVVAIAQRVRRR